MYKIIDKPLNLHLPTEHPRAMEDRVLHPLRHVRAGRALLRVLRLGRAAALERAPVAAAAGEAGGAAA